VGRAAGTLRELGHNPLVVATATRADQPDAERVDGIDVVRVRPGRLVAWLRRRTEGGAPRPGLAPAAQVSGPRGAALRAWRWLRTLDYYVRAAAVVVRERPALVHANDHNTMWPALAAKALVGSRVVYDSHELWPDRNGRWEWRPWLLAGEALFTHAADAVVTASPGYASVMARRYRIPEPAVVRNVPAATTGILREPGPPTAVYVGALIPGRGLEQAVDAVALVERLRLRVIGPGSPAAIDALRRRARDAGAGARVEILPPVRAGEVVAALAGASVGLNLIEPICLSYELTLPNKLFEYIAAGLPVLTSDIPICARFVREHGVGEVVPLRDAAVVAAALERLLDPARAADLRARALSLARELTWEREQPRLAAVYAAATR
jgi:glycosyltransferase involved in cell wall biosynthesis